MLSHLRESLSSMKRAAGKSEWTGNADHELKVAQAMGEIASQDGALMLALWPELSWREREIQAPMLAMRPEDLVEWMTAGARFLGVGEEALARRARERDLSWIGFREDGRDTWKRNDGMPASGMESLSPTVKRKVWGLALLNVVSPWKPCLAKKNSSADIGPLGGSVMSFAAGMWGSMIASSFASSGVSLAIGLTSWLALRGWQALGEKGRRARYLKYSALPKAVQWRRAWLARKEAARELVALQERFAPETVIKALADALGAATPSERAVWLSAREAEKKAKFEEACDPIKAARAFDSWMLGEASLAAKPDAVQAKGMARL
jgi:hypothetical protein